MGIDVSGTDNSTNVSLAGSLDYLTLSGQEITMGQVDYNSDISNTPTLLQLGTTSSTALAGNTTTISSAQSSAITANTAKTTNVTTDLSISGTTGARTIESSDGTDAIIPIATTDVSGLLSPSLFDEIDANTAKTGITSGQSSAITANTAKTTNVTTDLSISGTTGARTIESSDGTDAIIPIATTDVSGLLSPSLFDEIDANTAKTGITSGQSSAITANTAKTTNVTTDLSISGTTGARTIESSDGTDAIIPIATTDVSGLLSPSLFDEIDANTAKTGITSGQSSAITANTAKTTNVTTDLSISGTTGARTIESSDGTDAIIPIATTDVSGLLSPSLFDEIDANTAKTGITSGQSSAITANTAKTTNVTTDLSISGTTGARTIESSDGTDAIIPIATTDVSGLLSPSLFDEIDANTAKTGITSGQSSAITANTSKVTDSGIPALKSDGSDPSLNTGITAAEIRTLIGAASSTDNSTNVSLAGSLDYLTLSGQEITVSSITNDDLAGSIADSKLNQITTANKVAGSSVQLASGSALANSSGLNVTVDDSSIENNSGTLRVKADGISNSMIADPELKEFAGMTPASTGQYNFIAGTGDDFKALTVPETLTALGAGTMAIQNKESVNIDGGTIDGTTVATSNITVGPGKTLDVSSGTLTVANNQISGDKIEGGTIAAINVTALTSNKILASNKTITPAGTTGNQTINSMAGSVNFASSATTLTVTNNLVDANSVIILTKALQNW